MRELISPPQIEQAVAELGRRVSKDFAAKIDADGKPLILLGVLKGGFIFLADLARRMTIPVEIDFVMLSSYGNHLESTGAIELLLSPRVDLTDRRVLVVEDIVDSGRSLAKLLEYLRSLRPREIRLCTLLDKPATRVVEIPIDYVGFEVPDQFVVGYGLDAAQKYRALSSIYALDATFDRELR